MSWRIGLQALRSICRAPLRSPKRRRRSRPMPRKSPTAPWIVGRGWNQEQWGLGRFPDRRRARRGASPIGRSGSTRIDGHAGWANSRALAMAGVTAATADPGRRARRAHRAGGPARRACSSMRRWRWSIQACRRRRRDDRDLAFVNAQDLLLQARGHRGRRHGHERSRTGRRSAARAMPAACGSASCPMPAASRTCC